MSRPFVSVIIPTYNRAKLLPVTMDSFLKQTYPADRFEIIIANNNSGDDTAAVAQEYAKRDHVRYLFEPRQGVHYARNAAAKVAKGEILYFTDDDMIADAALLDELVRVFERDERIATATGRVIARFEETPPAWVERHMINGLLSVTEKERTEELLIAEEDVGVYSCHQGVRRDLFFAAGGFNPENTAGVWIGDGETGLNIKIRERGHKFAYTSRSVIHHFIPKERATFGYLLRRYGNQAFCDAYTDYRKYREPRRILGKALGRNSVGALRMLAGTLISILRGKRSWHFLPASLMYLHKRNIYDLRLLRDEEFRKLVEIDDWLSVA